MMSIARRLLLRVKGPVWRAVMRVTISVAGLLCISLTSATHSLDGRFTSGNSALAIPFDLDANNNIYLLVRVNGSRPVFFMLDTGASHNVLSLALAKSLGMKVEPAGTTIDATGAEPQDVYLVLGTTTFALPGLTFSDDTAVAISLDKMRDCAKQANYDERGQRLSRDQRVKRESNIIVDGILGRKFFDTFVVEIDYAARLINVYDPLEYEYKGSGKILPLEMDRRFLFVRAQVNAPGGPAVTARLIVDTGSASVLMLTKQFTDKHKLLPSVEKLTASTACGVGGYEKEQRWVGTLETLQLGSLKLTNPLTVFFQKSGAEDYDGYLGDSALKNFDVIFDCSRRRMVLERPLSNQRIR